MTTSAPARRRRRSSGARRPPSRAELDAVLVITALSALAGALSSAEPAGWLPADLVLRAGFAALVAFATARARRWTWIVLAGAAAVASDGWEIVLGLTALGIATLGSWPDRRSRPLGALVGALSVQALLRLDLDYSGMSALVAGAAVAPVLVTAYVRSRSRTRKHLRTVALILGGAAIAASAGLAVAVVLVQQQVEEAADMVRDGLEAVRDDDPDRAVALLTEASEEFEDAHSTVSTWGLAARLVPVVGHQARALAVVTGEGAELADAAARATVEGDTDEIRFDDGVVDLELVAGLEAPLADAEAALQQASDGVAEARTPWLLDPLSTGVAEFAEEVDRALPEAELAIEGVQVAPALFGGEGERRYFIAFTQPAEARGLGGFIGNFGELTAVDGDLELTRSGRIAELIQATDPATRELSGPEDYLARYGRFSPARFLQDLTYSPDGPSVARVMEELYPQAGGQPVDGVIIVDPYALAALMEFTGPIEVPGAPFPLTSENAADFLIREQYLAFQEDEDARVDFLDEASRITFERLTEGDIPGPRQVADVLGPMVDEGRLIVHSIHPDEQAVIERVDLDGALPPGDGDFLSLTTQNAGNSKIDMFLRREVTYEARWDPESGRVEATAVVTLHNDAPGVGLPRVVIGNNRGLPSGTHRVFLSLYSALQVADASEGDQPLLLERQRERDRWVNSTVLDLPPGSSTTLEFELLGAIPPGREYNLSYAPQPLVNPDEVTLRVAPTGAWVVHEADGFDIESSGAVLRTQSTGDRSLSARVIRR